jgi:hypothetical protein
MAATFRNRSVQINQVVFDQVDIFNSDFFNPVTGLLPASIGFTLTVNNQAVGWTLVDGVGVADGLIVAGSVYWSELPSSSYGIRFFPSSLGRWVLDFAFAPSPSQKIMLGFDVVNLPTFVEQGLRSSFCV